MLYSGKLYVKVLHLFSKLSDPDKSVDLKSLAAGIHSKLPKYARPLFLRRMTKVNNYFLSIHIFFVRQVPG